MDRISGRFDYKKPEDAKIAKFSKGKTQQQFAKEADINNIMMQYQRTGILGNPLTGSGRTPMFGDFSTGTDFTSVQNRIVEVQRQFMRLPSNIRSRFNNDPAMLLDFIADPANKDEAIKLGLIANDLPAGKVDPKVETAEKPVETAEKPVS